MRPYSALHMRSYAGNLGLLAAAWPILVMTAHVVPTVLAVTERTAIHAHPVLIPPTLGKIRWLLT